MAIGDKDYLRKQLGFYDWDDVAQCACELVKRYGVADVRNILEKLKSLSEINADLQEYISDVIARIDSIISLADSILNLNPLERLIYRELSKLKVCPLVDNLIYDILGDINILKNIQLGEWFGNRAGAIIGALNTTNQVLSESQEKLLRFAELIKVMDACSTESIPESKNYEDVLLGHHVVVPPNIEKSEEHYDIPPMGTVANVNGETWYAFEKDGFVKVARKINSVWQSPVDVTEGYYPKIFFDGTRVNIYFSKNYKIGLVSMLPHELSLIEVPFSLWDCSKITFSLVEKNESIYICGFNSEYGRLFREPSTSHFQIQQFKDGLRGFVPVPESFRVLTDRLQWQGVTVDTNYFDVSYRVYEDGNMLAELTSTEYIYEASSGTDYWVTAVYTNKATGVVTEGYPSNRDRLTGVIRVRKQEDVSYSQQIIERHDWYKYFYDVVYVNDDVNSHGYVETENFKTVKYSPYIADSTLDNYSGNTFAISAKYEENKRWPSQLN